MHNENMSFFFETSALDGTNVELVNTVKSLMVGLY
jgi:hypothetical protein